jgi:ABC-2 type transport system permease protein
MMNLTRVGAIALRQFYLWRGSPQRVLTMFTWVAVDILVWGFISLYLNQVSQAGLDFMPLLLGAALLWDFLARVMQGVTTAFFEDVWSRNFLNIFATPLKTSEYLAGLVSTSVVSSAISLATMLLLAGVAFGPRFLSDGWALLPLLLVLFLSGIALGIVGAAIVLRLGPASEWLIWPIPTLLSPFAAVFYPLSVLPAWMRTISAVVAPSYVFEGMRAVVAHRPVPWTQLATGAGLSIAYVLVACLFFTLVYRDAIRTGRIARYSAESTS